MPLVHPLPLRELLPQPVYEAEHGLLAQVRDSSFGRPLRPDFHEEPILHAEAIDEIVGGIGSLEQPPEREVRSGLGNGRRRGEPELSHVQKVPPPRQKRPRRIQRWLGIAAQNPGAAGKAGTAKTYLS